MMPHLTDKQVTQFRERLLSPAELLQVGDHIAQCPQCRGRVADEVDLRASLQKRASPAEHLTYEQIETYLDGKASSTQMEAVQTHVKTCQLCLDEIKDLESFKNEMAATEPASSREQNAPWLQRLSLQWYRKVEQPAPQKKSFLLIPSRTTLALAAAAAVLVLFAIGFKRMRFVPSPAEPSTQVASADRIGKEIAGLPAKEKASILEAVSQERVKTTAALAELRGPRQTLLGEAPAAQAFHLISPVGEVVMDARPVFLWDALAGASGYSVAIFDANLNAVETSPLLKQTQWKPELMLKRGQVYQWQVTAMLAGGKSVHAPAPPNPEAKFLVLEQEKAGALARFQAEHPQAHLVLGILDAQSGMLAEGMLELEKIPASDADYALAQKLLKSIQEIRQPAN